MISSAEECDSLDDMQLLVYQRAMHVWRELQRKGRELEDVSEPKFLWVDAGAERLELGVFPLLKYEQLVCEPPPLPFIAALKGFAEEEQ